MSLFWSCRSVLCSSRRGDSHTRVGWRSNLATEAEGTESVAVRVMMGDEERLCVYHGPVQMIEVLNVSPKKIGIQVSNLAK